MSVVERIDAATLGWVKAELDQSIGEIRSALDHGVSTTTNGAALRVAISHTNQVEGTLHMVELYGASMLAAEIKVTIDHILSHCIEDDPEDEHQGERDGATNNVDWFKSAVSDRAPLQETHQANREHLATAVHEALVALSTHLDDLRLGGIDLPLKLLPATNALRIARNAPVTEPMQLFDPDLSTQPPQRQERITLTDVEYREKVTSVHRHYQRTLLQFLNEGHNRECLEQLTALMDSLMDITRFGVVCQVWWVSRAFLRSLAEGTMEITKTRCVLLANIDRELKRTGDQGEVALVKNRPTTLVKQMLFELGECAVEHEDARDVKLAFQLAQFFDDEPSAIEDGPTTISQLIEFGAAANTSLDDVRDTMALYFESDTRSPQTLRQLQSQVIHLRDLATKTQSEVAVDIFTELERITGEIADGQLSPSDRTALVLANALRTIENMSREQPLPSSNWRQDIDGTVKALRELTANTNVGEPVANSRPEGRELRQLIGTVSPGLRVALQTVEDAVEVFALNPSDPSVLEPASDALTSASGDLDALGQGRVGELMDLVTFAVDGLRSQQLEPLPRLLESMAFGVGAAQSHIQSLDGDGPRVGGIVDRAVDELDEILGDERTSTISSRSLADSLKSRFDVWLEQPHDSSAFRSLRQDLRAAQAMGAQYGEERIGHLSFEMMSILDIIVDSPQSFSQEVSETLTASNAALLLRLRELPDDVLDDVPIALADDEPVDAAEAEAVVDDEIFQIFVEESEQALELIQVRSEKWQANPQVDDALVEIRRGFHILKGSGDLVGIQAIGDLARVVEELLNNVISGEIRPTARLVPLVNDARYTLAYAMEQPDPKQVEIDIQPWLHRAQEIRDRSDLDSDREQRLRRYAQEASDDLDRLQRAASVSVECTPGLEQWSELSASVAHLDSGARALEITPVVRVLTHLKHTLGEIERDADEVDELEKNTTDKNRFTDRERALLLRSHEQLTRAVDTIAKTGATQFTDGFEHDVEQLEGDFELERDARIANRLSHRAISAAVIESVTSNVTNTVTTDKDDENQVKALDCVDNDEDASEAVTVDDPLKPRLVVSELPSLRLDDPVDDHSDRSDQDGGVLDDVATPNKSVIDPADVPTLDVRAIRTPVMDAEEHPDVGEIEYELPAHALIDLPLDEIEPIDDIDGLEIIDTDLFNDDQVQSSETDFDESDAPADESHSTLMRESNPATAEDDFDEDWPAPPSNLGGRITPVSPYGDVDFDDFPFLEHAPNAVNIKEKQENRSESLEYVDDGFRVIFCNEADKILERMRESFAHFSAGVGGETQIRSYQHDLHTIKGSARTVGYFQIADLVHAAESGLETNSAALSAGASEPLAIFEEFQDSLQVTIARLHKSADFVPDLGALTERINAFATMPSAESSEGDESGPFADSGADSESLQRQNASLTKIQRDSDPSIETLTPLSSPVALSASIATNQWKQWDRPKKTHQSAQSQQLDRSDQRVSESMEDHSIDSSDQPVSTRRISAEQIDALIDQVGELTIVRSRLHGTTSKNAGYLAEMQSYLKTIRERIQVLEAYTKPQITPQSDVEVAPSKRNSGAVQDAQNTSDTKLTRLAEIGALSRSLSEQLNRLELVHRSLSTSNARADALLAHTNLVTNKLQDNLQRTKMVQVSSIDVRLRHLVRETARELSKQCQFTFDCDDIEIDSHILDGIVVSLEHMIRNALDHGIESAPERSRTHKPVHGLISLTCRRKDHDIEFELTDDGRGIDRDAVIDQARKQGIAIDDVALQTDDLLSLILSLGFTTRSTVTQLSGRGIGMDVVHETLVQLGGVLALQSTPGQGTQFVVRVPERSSTISAYRVRLADREFAIDDDQIERIVSSQTIDITASLSADGARFTLDGRQIPVLPLHEIVEIKMTPASAEPHAVLVANVSGQQFAVVVDFLGEKQQMTSQPLGTQLIHVHGIQGATVTSDGEVVLLLDIKTLWQSFHI